MNKTQIDEAIWAELLNYDGKDVKVYYEQGANKIVWGFYIWGGESHQETSVGELCREGFDLADIKVLREEAATFLMRQITRDKLQVIK